MNREIKFRWYDSFNKKMVDDCFYGGDSKGVNDIIATFEGDLELMQYTGLKDKNGKEIWEGDVVKWDGFYVKEAMVTDKFFGTREMQPIQVDKSGVNTVEFKDGRFRIESIQLEMCDYEVIGNIYENPELIEKI